MSVKVPILDCCCSFETFTSSHTQKKEIYKKAMLSLNRNEFSEIVLNVAVVDKGANTIRFKLSIISDKVSIKPVNHFDFL